MNNVNIIGRVSSDILKFYIKEFDKNVISFAIACDDRTRQSDGKKFTNYFDVEAWSIVADRIYENVQKGDKIAINGHLEQQKFTKKDGTNGYKVKIIVSSVEFLSPKRKDNQENETQEIENEEEDDNTLPF